MTDEHCPTCGGRAVAVTGNEGTSHFVPFTNGDLRAENTRLREGGKQLDEVIVRLSEENTRLREVLERIATYDSFVWSNGSPVRELAREALDPSPEPSHD